MSNKHREIFTERLVHGIEVLPRATFNSAYRKKTITYFYTPQMRNTGGEYCIRCDHISSAIYIVVISLLLQRDSGFLISGFFNSLSIFDI